MDLKTKMIIVPYWVHETLRRNHMELREVLNFDKIRPLFSAVDLAGFMSLQAQWGCIVGDPDGFYGDFELDSAWRVGGLNAANRNWIETTLWPLMMDETFKAAVAERLFNGAHKRERDEHPFITYDLAPEVGAIVIYPGHFTSTKSFGTLQDCALREILKLLYAHSAENEVAKTPWFRQYLFGLSVGMLAA